MELFKLLGTIVIENAEAVKSLRQTSTEAKKTGDAVEDSAEKAESSSSRWGGALKKIGSGAVALGKTVVAGIGVAAGALAGLTVKALSSAGELEQNMGGSEAVFAEHADKIQAKAKEAFSNMGLSTSDYLATANKMGALFKGAGFETEEALDLSSNAMQRAADVASIMGIDTASAMEAVAGAAKGNFTMMDNLGVAMNDTTLNAYALEKGINKTTQEMTNQEKISLAMEMFMEKTAYAAGNYAKENQTLAGSLGTAKAALSNFISGAGSVDDVVTSFSNAADVIIKNINELFPSLVNGIVSLVNKIVPMIPTLLKQLLPGLIDGAIALINGLVAAMPQIVSALLAVVPALLGGIMQIMQSILEALPQIINMLIAAFPQIVLMLVQALPVMIPALIDGLVSMIVTLCEHMPEIIQPIIDYLPDIIEAIVTALVNNLPALINAGMQLIGGLFQGCLQMVQDIPRIMGTIFNGIMTAIKSLFGIHSPSTVMAGIGGNIMEGLFGGIQKLMGKLTNIWNNVKEAITKPIETAKNTIKGIVDKIKGFFSGMKISFPKIKMPHFSVKPSGWKIGDLLKGSIPKLGVEWYAKAMNNPVVMTQPTVFGYNSQTGQLMGGGESGSEMVGGTNTVMNMIKAAVSSENSAIVYYLQKLIEILATYFPQVLESMERDVVLDSGAVVGALAVPMDRAIGKISTRKERGR
jgi:phage-related protein